MRDTDLIELLKLKTRGGLLNFHSTAEAHAAWREITGIDRYESGQAPNVLIREPHLAILHRFMTLTYSGQWEESKVFRPQLYAIDCMRHSRDFSTYAMIIDCFARVISDREPRRLYLGHIISVIAKAKSPKLYANLEGPKIRPIKLGIKKLQMSYLVEKIRVDGKEVVRYKPWATRQAVIDRFARLGLPVPIQEQGPQDPQDPHEQREREEEPVQEDEGYHHESGPSQKSHDYYGELHSLRDQLTTLQEQVQDYAMAQQMEKEAQQAEWEAQQAF